MLTQQWKLLVPAILAIGLLIFAYAHKAQFDDIDNYRESIFIPFEFAFLIGSILSSVVVLCAAVVFIFKRQWSKALLNIVSVIGTYIALAIGLYVDSPTLIYMT